MARVAILLASMFEDREFIVPLSRLQAAGHEVVVVGRVAGEELLGKAGGVRPKVQRGIDDVSADEFDALVIPGGWSPDRLRTDPRVVEFTRQMFNSEKPIAAICHAGSLLVEADVANGRRVTSWPSIKTDLVNAGASWVDEDVVEDGPLITSRGPADLPAFCDALLEALDRGTRRTACAFTEDENASS